MYSEIANGRVLTEEEKYFKVIYLLHGLSIIEIASATLHCKVGTYSYVEFNLSFTHFFLFTLVDYVLILLQAKMAIFV